MDDLISRKAAIDLFPNDALEWDTMGGFVAPHLARRMIEELPSAQPEIIYCKDCAKHNKGHGYYLDGTVIGIKDCCPLVEIRGMAQGHEFDYQYCAYAERRTDG